MTTPSAAQTTEGAESVPRPRSLVLYARPKDPYWKTGVDFRPFRLRLHPVGRRGSGEEGEALREADHTTPLAKSSSKRTLVGGQQLLLDVGGNPARRDPSGATTVSERSRAFGSLADSGCTRGEDTSRQTALPLPSGRSSRCSRMRGTAIYYATTDTEACLPWSQG